MAEDILRKDEEAYKLFQKFEMARYKVLRHTGMMDPTVVNTAPGTRSSELIYTTRIETECQDCNARHTEMGHRSYLAHFACLPFKCKHGLKITMLYEEDPEDRTLPAIQLPATIIKVAPCSVTETTGGEIDEETLDRDKERLESSHKLAAEAFLEVGAKVLREGFNVSVYPSWAPSTSRSSGSP